MVMDIKLQSLFLLTIILLILNVSINAIEVDVYQFIGDVGNEGEVLTTNLISASTIGENWTSEKGSGTLWLSKEYFRRLPGSVIVNGIKYTNVGSRTWKYCDNYELNMVHVISNDYPGPYRDRMTVACYYTVGPLLKPSNLFGQHDNIVVGSTGSFAVLQTIRPNDLFIEAHSYNKNGTTISPKIKIEPGKTYWVNLHFDGIGGICKVAVFDPDNNWIQVGKTVAAESIPGTKIRSRAKFGRCSKHNDKDWPNEVFSYFSHILIDYTNAAFPLLPDLSNNSSDSIPPIISSIKVIPASTRSSSAYISWGTNEPATSRVEYGLTTSYGQSTPFDAILKTSHLQALTGLEGGKLYHFRISVQDSVGNRSISADQTFETNADEVPPIISNINVKDISGSGATISWSTNELADSKIEYGLTTAYGAFTPLNTKFNTSHTHILSGLVDKKKYHYRVHSTDGSGNIAISADQTFTTTAINTSAYWVSPNGQASWEMAKSEIPLDGKDACNLKTANANLQPGDLVYLRKGTYDNGDYICPKRSGTSDNQRITYSNYNSEKVTITDTDYGILLDGKSYITVKGIDFYYLGHFLFILNNSDHNIIGFCTFDQTRKPSAWEGSKIYFTSQFNRVHNCTFSKWGSGTGGSMFDVGRSSVSTDSSYYNLIEDNTFFYGGHHCLAAWSKYSIFRNNFLHNEQSADGVYGYRCAISHGQAADRNLFEGNRISFAHGAAGMSLRSSNNIFRFNSFYKNAHGGIQIATDGKKENTRADRNHIYHNVFFQNGYEAPSAGFSGGIYFADWGRGDPEGNVVKNNIFYKNKGGSITFDGVNTPQVVLNNWENANDPLFIDDESPLDPFNPNLPNFKLQKQSLCIDKGIFLTKITSANGTGKEFQVEDAGYFMDGWGMTKGDEIQFEGRNQRATITKVDYENNIITVNKELTWTQNIGVSLAYEGLAPDIGAIEYTTGIQIFNIPSGKGKLPKPHMLIYPGPFRGESYIYVNNIPFNQLINGKMSIYNLSGKLVEELRLQDRKYIWKNSSYPTGTYLLKYEGSINFLNQKLLLVK